jgi:hypothetical protein
MTVDRTFIAQADTTTRVTNPKAARAFGWAKITATSLADAWDTLRAQQLEIDPEHLELAEFEGNRQIGEWTTHIHPDGEVPG